MAEMTATQVFDELLDRRPVLDDAHAFVGRFVSFPTPAAHVAYTLWAAHTHCVNRFSTSPRLALLSPEPESGKTRGLDVLTYLAARAEMHVSISPAALYRMIEAEQPTVLLDEVDNVFGKRNKDDADDLKPILNNGYRAGATVPRCHGQSHEIRRFKVYAPVALAGIGDKFPEILLTRCIVIRMRRAVDGEIEDDLDHDEHAEEGWKLRDRLAGWLEDAPLNRRPELPAGLRSRVKECWRPLVAVADAAGGRWPTMARDALRELSRPQVAREASLGIKLLTDLHAVFTDAGMPSGMHTIAILAALKDLSESPWADLHGTGLHDRGLASMLGRYEVASKPVRVGEVVRKGYTVESLAEPWRRYLNTPIVPPEEGLQGLQGLQDDPQQDHVTLVTPNEKERTAEAVDSATLCAADGCPHEARNALVTCAAHAMLELKIRTERGIPL
jgi:hypothetical protein